LKSAASEIRSNSRNGAKAAKIGLKWRKYYIPILLFPAELGAFAPWREEFPKRKVLVKPESPDKEGAVLPAIIVKLLGQLHPAGYHFEMTGVTLRS
jgi:hypothetical protein